MNDTIYVLTALNIILTILNFVRSSKDERPSRVVYKQPSYRPVKRKSESKPRFRARAPSNTELYNREVFGDDKKNPIQSDN